MLNLLLALSLAAAADQSPAAAPPAPKPCTSSEHRQFDFWIGDWDVVVNGKPAGRNRIESIEGGCGLQENWTAAGGSTGRSINAYWPGDRKWHQIWLGSGGLLMHLSGTFSGPTLTLTGDTITPGGQKLLQRLSFTNRPDGTIRQLWEQSTDGASWKVAFEGIYRRRK